MRRQVSLEGPTLGVRFSEVPDSDRGVLLRES